VSDIVADASAVIALMTGEPFRDFDPTRLVGAWISAVNLAEILSKLCDAGLSPNAADEATSALDLRVVPFDAAQARATARIRAETRRAGLSLGDRACLAAALALGVPAATADRAWARVKSGATVIMVR